MHEQTKHYKVSLATTAEDERS